MPMQLTLDFTTKPPLRRKPVIENATWLDVSEIARGVGFTTTVQVSIALQDALEPLQSEIDGDYDQRLYDALWRAHFQLSLDPRSSATFNFIFPRKHEKADETIEASLRLRVEAQKQVVLLGLMEDFRDE
jgi:hypothetical protein